MKTLRMVFQFDGTKTVTYNLADPKDGITGDEVTAAMQEIIDKSAILVDGLHPVSIKEALIRSTDDTQLVG